MEFKKYTSIDNCTRQKTIDSIICSGFGNEEWVATLKVHGANVSFKTNNEDVAECLRPCFSKRSTFVYNPRTNKSLEALNSFYNCHNVYIENELKFSNLVNYLFENGLASKEITLFGELFGGIYPHPEVKRITTATAVQNGIYYSPVQHFYAFDLYLDDVPVNYYLFQSLMVQFEFLYAEPLCIGSFEECLDYPNKFEDPLYKKFYLPKIDGNICEGVVIKPIRPRCFACGQRVILKNKNEKWTEVSKKHKKPKLKIELSPAEQLLLEEMLEFVTENRLRNVLSKIGIVTDKEFGKLQGLFTKDALDDFWKDNSTDIEKKRLKILTKLLQLECGKIIKKNFVNIIDGVF